MKNQQQSTSVKEDTLLKHSSIGILELFKDLREPKKIYKSKRNESKSWKEKTRNHHKHK